MNIHIARARPKRRPPAHAANFRTNTKQRPCQSQPFQRARCAPAGAADPLSCHAVPGVENRSRESLPRAGRRLNICAVGACSPFGTIRAITISVSDPNKMPAVRPRLPSALAALALAACIALPAQAERIFNSQNQPPAPQALSQSCTTECHLDIIAHKVMHGPSLTKCDSCHVQGNAKEHKFYYIVPKEELCARCHRLPHENTMHPPAQQGRCLDCHDPHGSDFPKALVADPRRELCAKCHTQNFWAAKFVHGPVAAGACVICHKPHSSQEPGLLTTDQKSLCLSCHDEVLAQGQQGMHMHAALEQGCTRCHDPHASDHKYQLREQAPALCLSCHKEYFDQTIAGAAVVHGAVLAEGGCTTCHEPHSSRLPSLQRGTQPQSCLLCHNKIMTDAAGATIADMASLLALNPDHHGPIREGACTACHEPHAGQRFRLLKDEYPPQFYAPFDIKTFTLCFRCHIPDLVLKEAGRGLTQFRDGDRNLHYLHVNQEKGRTCRACHEVHASKRPAHIREAVPFGSAGWLLEINFKQLPDGGTCAPGCHTERTYNRGKPPGLAPTGAAGATR